jgi:S-adenosyl-L-methionine hydrolase (adenosine-forming)
VEHSFRSPIITLTTDFGLKDAYVASMKGVILGIAPETRIVDISHEVPPQGIVEGGFTLACAFPCFPPGSIHVLVVDPGVGTSRRLLLVRTENHYFLAPDNGALGLALSLEAPRELIQITASHYFRPGTGATFHGRDILAPVAARLALGTAARHFGEPVEGYVPYPAPPPEIREDGTWTLRVIVVDRFGNLVLNLRETEYLRASTSAAPGGFTLELAGTTISRLLKTYGEAVGNEPFALFNSSGYLEVAVRNGSAAALLGCSAGTQARCSA